MLKSFFINCPHMGKMNKVRVLGHKPEESAEEYVQALLDLDEEFRRKIMARIKVTTTFRGDGVHETSGVEGGKVFCVVEEDFGECRKFSVAVNLPFEVCPWAEKAVLVDNPEKT